MSNHVPDRIRRLTAIRAEGGGVRLRKLYGMHHVWKGDEHVCSSKDYDYVIDKADEAAGRDLRRPSD